MECKEIRWQQRAEQAEAACADLRQALEFYADTSTDNVARKALANTEVGKQAAEVLRAAEALRHAHALLIEHMNNVGVTDAWDDLMIEREELCQKLWQSVDAYRSQREGRGRMMTEITEQEKQAASWLVARTIWKIADLIQTPIIVYSETQDEIEQETAAAIAHAREAAFEAGRREGIEEAAKIAKVRRDADEQEATDAYDRERYAHFSACYMTAEMIERHIRALLPAPTATETTESNHEQS